MVNILATWHVGWKIADWIDKRLIAVSMNINTATFVWIL